MNIFQSPLMKGETTSQSKGVPHDIPNDKRSYAGPDFGRTYSHASGGAASRADWSEGSDPADRRQIASAEEKSPPDSPEFSEKEVILEPQETEVPFDALPAQAHSPDRAKAPRGDTHQPSDAIASAGFRSTWRVEHDVSRPEKMVPVKVMLEEETSHHPNPAMRETDVSGRMARAELPLQARVTGTGIEHDKGMGIRSLPTQAGTAAPETADWPAAAESLNGHGNPLPVAGQATPAAPRRETLVERTISGQMASGFDTVSPSAGPILHHLRHASRIEIATSDSSTQQDAGAPPPSRVQSDQSGARLPPMPTAVQRLSEPIVPARAPTRGPGQPMDPSPRTSVDSAPQISAAPVADSVPPGQSSQHPALKDLSRMATAQISSGEANNNVSVSTAATPDKMRSMIKASATGRIPSLGPNLGRANANIGQGGDDLNSPPIAELSATARIETVQVPQAPQHTLHQRPDLPVHIARQLAEAMQGNSLRPVDIALNPEELGRLRLTMSVSDSGMVMHVTAERPDTLDLVRRHIAELSQEFRDIGYPDVSFSFADGNARDEGRATPLGATEPDGEGTPDNPVEITLSAAPDTGVDIRL